MDFLVSIIIPVYNVASYIERCLQSVANQTLTESVECVLVDDCGQDDSIKIAESYINNYQGHIKFKIIKHDVNGGLSCARNTGIKNAQGKYLYFLDSDDAIVPTCIEGFVNIINQHPEVELIQGLFEHDSPYMKQFLNKDIPSYSDNHLHIKKMLLDYNMLPVCVANKMISRKLLLDKRLFMKEGIIHEDNYWTFFLAKHIYVFALYRDKCYIYYENPNSITKSINTSKEINAFKTMIEDFCDNIDPVLKGEQKVLIYDTLRLLLSSGYLTNEAQRKKIINKYCSILTNFEYIFFNIWNYMPSDLFLKSKLGNLFIRILRINN
ncbi:glycosyltransferase family 2 protein [Prevotella koreensis]|uniref:glycosyltransferase family 2 protein n=1 Tax=Prevotella koreensis TaxID=2490854 RepID=UPI003F9FD661